MRFEWVIEDKLARSHRPGYSEEKGLEVPRVVVDEWITHVLERGVKSIICLLGDDQMVLYADLPNTLTTYYQEAGFEVVHVPALDHRRPPLTEQQLAAVWAAYTVLPKPVLIHCSAGVDRTGAAVRHIETQLSLQSPPSSSSANTPTSKAPRTLR